MASEKPKGKEVELVVGALGRPFTLGMLYNAPKDQLVPGLVLWDADALKQLTASRPQRSSDFSICASNSTDDSSFSLNVDASLKLSFMSGTIQVGGSANYLNDKKQFHNQSRVTLQYQATTCFQQLCLTPAACQDIRGRKQDRDQGWDWGLATHMVTGIEYGANAFFVFDSEKVEASEVQTVKGQMQVVINKIPTCSVDGSAKVDLTDEEKKLVQTFSVKFYGDFLLKQNPATFDAAVQTYADLPKLLLGAEGEEPVNTVPMRVWLLPLEALGPQPTTLTKGVSLGLLLRAESVLEDLSEVMMRCNDCLSVSAVGKLPQLHKQLHQFHQLCHYYTLELQRRMAEACPAIRDGTESESVLRGVFQKRLTSAFSQDRLTMWLQDKEREVNVVQSCLEVLEGVPVLSSQAQVDRFVLDPEKAVCSGYIFTSLGRYDHQIEDMMSYMESLEDGDAPDMPGPDPDQALPWFYNDGTITAMREAAVAFMKDKNDKDKNDKDKIDKKFVAAILDSSHQGSSVNTFQNGIRILVGP